MKKPMALVVMTAVSAAGAATDELHKPVVMEADGKRIETEPPGYAAPCIADVTGDGKVDLLVGQFTEGRIKVYPGDGSGKFGAGKWLQADGKAAEVPGVW